MSPGPSLLLKLKSRDNFMTLQNKWMVIYFACGILSLGFFRVTNDAINSNAYEHGEYKNNTLLASGAK